MPHDREPRPVIFGEVLYDRFPDGSVVLGGAPFNVAWHLQAFGARPLLVSRVGDDALGRAIRDAMHAWGMDAAGLQMDSRHPTGTVEVTFVADEPRYEIVPGRAWDHVDAGAVPPLGAVSVLYHGSLALRETDSRAALARLKETVDAPVLVDVNLRDPWWDEDTLARLLTGARWAKLNEDELQRLAPGPGDLATRAAALLAARGLELLVVTQGARGVTAFGAGGETVQVLPERNIPVVDTVGAGDAFASVLLLGLTRGWPLDRTLGRAQGFASAVVGLRGATTRDRELYRPFLDGWGLA